MSISELYKIFRHHPVISTDTRKISEGSIFFALKGPNFNANSFAKEALSKGAAYCVIDEEAFLFSDKTILVNDVLECLQQLATHHRKQLNKPVIAIAGSNGKTTTKELLNAVLSTRFKVWATPGNFNNHIGLPLTLLQLTDKHDIAVIEMGANHVGENEFLCKIAMPDYGIVTNNGMDHLEGFGDLEGVAKSNSELYYYLLNNNGTAFVNANDEWLMRMSARLTKVITYAANTATKTATADISGMAVRLQPQIVFSLNNEQGCSSLSGDYNFDNIMASVAIATHFGVETQNIIKGIAAYTPSNNRSQWVQRTNNTVFLDAYNANPSSMELALKNFAEFAARDKLVIMGDMFEMGDFAQREHQRMADLSVNLGFDKIILVGNDFYNTHENEKLVKFRTTAEASQYLQQYPPDGKAIFIKGSRGMKLETLMELIP